MSFNWSNAIIQLIAIGFFGFIIYMLYLVIKKLKK
ncbi:hypothetical protein DFP98_11453 [Cohnella phaseoli]|uniref:Uncharacterized protein n=1 Tax=Cohnella phaseoli TaxID=456490 RepID=A0A3D9JNS5_9BACL|nr:hypothetical protein DFP98_11453 [Cohnella phaseoli]